MIETWQAQIKEAAARKTPLQLSGGGTKDQLGEIVQGQRFDTRAHAGIVAYEPNELVMTARCGTPLAEVEKTMAEAGQMLAFEAPYARDGATIGGAFASGLSGPRRPYVGAVRDFVLGAEIIDGKGDYLRFGGQVMKNVAGFDVSRLQCGAWGTLGLVTQVSFKCLPLPKAQATLRMQLSADQFLERCATWASAPLPISGAAWVDGVARVRLSGAHAAVKSATEKLGGEQANDDAWWADLRDQRLPFFNATESVVLWRLSVKATSPFETPFAQHGGQLLDWSGAQRFVRTSQGQSKSVRAWAEKNGGHAQVIGNAERGVTRFHLIQPALLTIHQRMKTTFDPYGIFNVGRLIAESVTERVGQ